MAAWKGVEIIGPERTQDQSLGGEGGTAGHRPSQPSGPAANHRTAGPRCRRRYAPAVPAAEPVADGLRPPARSGGPWTWDLTAPSAEALPLVLHMAQRRLPVGTRVALTASRAVGADRLGDLVVGAGFGVQEGPSAGRRDTLVVVAERERTLADSVAPGMRILVCGVNPSPFSADAGVGYARPGNRFWPAALAAGVVDVDRDPVVALSGGLGMTDFAKRPTRTAAEVTRSEYTSGFDRVSRLVEWLAPGAVCFVGLSGWRTVVDRHAVAGVQPTPVGGRPAYVMPSTSGLNARTPLAELADHLRMAWSLGEPSP